jgi:hypothetical protein
MRMDKQLREGQGHGTAKSPIPPHGQRRYDHDQRGNCHHRRGVVAAELLDEPGQGAFEDWACSTN